MYLHSQLQLILTNKDIDFFFANLIRDTIYCVLIACSPASSQILDYSVLLALRSHDSLHMSSVRTHHDISIIS